MSLFSAVAQLEPQLGGAGTHGGELVQLGMQGCGFAPFLTEDEQRGRDQQHGRDRSEAANQNRAHRLAKLREGGFDQVRALFFRRIGV